MTPRVTHMLDPLDSFIKGWFHFEIYFGPFHFIKLKQKTVFSLNLFMLFAHIYIYTPSYSRQDLNKHTHILTHIPTEYVEIAFLKDF